MAWLLRLVEGRSSSGECYPPTSFGYLVLMHANSSSDVVYSYKYDARTRTASSPTVLVKGMHNPGHTTRTLFISPSRPNHRVVAVGSNGNIDLTAATVDDKGKPKNGVTGTAQIRVFDLKKVKKVEGGVPYTEGGVLGYGLRNDVGIAEDRVGTVFSIGAYLFSIVLSEKR